MISTRDMSHLPDVAAFRRLLQSLAMLDAILMPDWQYRYYSFNAHWSDGEQMGSMRNGCGDSFFAHFSSVGCWLKGFAHEYPMSPYRNRPPRRWLGVLDHVPPEFAGCLSEAAFSIQDVTFCIWRRFSDPSWRIGDIEFPLDHPDPDGSAFLLSDLDARPETYRDFSFEYYERELELNAISHVYAHLPLTDAVITSLNPELTMDDLEPDIIEIDYPR